MNESHPPGMVGSNLNAPCDVSLFSSGPWESSALASFSGKLSPEGAGPLEGTRIATPGEGYSQKFPCLGLIG